MTGRNIKNGFFEHLGKTIKDAFLVFSAQGEIFFFNDEAKSLLNIPPLSKNIFEIFSQPAQKKFQKFVNSVLENLNFISSPVALELSSGETINVEIILSCYNLEDQQVVLCTLSKKCPDIKSGEAAKVRTQLNKIEELIGNKRIIEIISKIKTSYPFTFLGKEKLRAAIDTFDEIFWVRNAEGIYLLVNKNLAKALGSNAVQVEGKEENSFLAPYLAEFNWTLDNYLKQTGNCLIIEGLPFKGLSPQGSLQTIEIPLRDADNNVTAVIGITQKKISGSGSSDRTGQLTANEIIGNLPVPFAYFNREENLIHSTEEFCKLFRIHFPVTGKFTFRQLPANFAAKFDDFISSPLSQTKFEFSRPDLGHEFQEGFLCCHLKKVYGCSNQFEGITLLIEESSSELNQRGKMINTFIEKNPEPIFVYDKDNLKFLDVNKSALSLYGYNKEQFLQMDLTDLYSAEDIQSLLESSEYASKEGEFTGPFKHKKKDGSLIVVELSKIGIKYNDKDAFLNIIRDFSDKFEQEKKNRLYKSAFDKTDDLLFITDASGFIKLTNNAVGGKLGYSEKELNDASFATLTIDEERGNINSLIFQSNSKDPQAISTTLKKNSGEEIKAELNVTPILDYKNEIDSFNIIAKLQADEAKSPAKAETSDDSTGTISPVFLSSLFHEILTPINAILGFVQELTESIQTKTPEQKEAAKIINQNRASLLHTLNTIAEYTSLERNEYDISFEEVHITEIVEKLQKEIEEFSGLRGTEFAYGKISSSLEFKTDKYKFMSLLSVLIRMVIRLTREKKIFLSAYQLDEEFFMVTIRDQHSSVSKYLLDCLNSIFQKEKVEKEFGVSRISINLSKKLLNLLNGRFEILVKEGNKLDYGFLFPFGFPVEQKKIEKEHVKAKDKLPGKKAKEDEKHEPEVKTIPLEEGIKWEGGQETAEELVLEEFEPQPEPPPAKPSKQIDLSKITCLYIEDQIDSQILFKVQMKDLNDIKFAVSFEEAIPLFKSYNFDLIVIDMNLSGEYNGLDALKMIHQISGFETTPVIAVSAYVLPGDKEKFISSGFSDFISKPLFREKMIDSVNKIFQPE
ncbi:MAG TPA: PAS domain S-box protein [Ignavibacteriaceae bacterium]|nr:PAS domain S-box protein [Ignavibacteriaceae bacterium]